MAKNLLRAMIKASNRTPGRINTQEVIEKIESGYLVNDRDTFKTKKSFSPSTLVYGHGACPRYWYLAFHGAEFNDVVTPHQVANMRNGSLAHERIQQAIADAGILVPKKRRSFIVIHQSLVTVTLKYFGTMQLFHVKLRQQTICRSLSARSQLPPCHTI